jgi:hypothetical protein
MDDKKRKAISIGAVLLMGIFSLGVVGYYNGKQVVNLVPYMSMISHSIYRTGETGQIIARLVDYQDNPVSVNWCKAYINYPDKTVWINGDLMTDDSGNLTGNHFYSFTVPATEGVYEYGAECQFNKTPSITMTRKVVNSFQVSPSFNQISAINNTLTVMNGSLYEIQTAVGQVNSTLNSVSTTVNGVAYNVSLIYQDTQSLKASALDTAGNFTALNVRLDGVDSNLSVLKNYCGDANTNSSPLCVLVNEIKIDVGAINVTMLNAQTVYLQEINATTHSTYDYMTGTLTNKVDDVLGMLSSIGGTVNATYSIVTAVNSTTTTILTNQQDDYRMSVSAG